MEYIYCYTNKINGHKYVGQTNNIKRRIRLHRSAAFNPKSSSYNHLFHTKLRLYGELNFTFEILLILYTNDINIVNEREQFWIKEKQSFRGLGTGYNSDWGGNNKNHSTKLSNLQINEVIEKIKQGISYMDLENEYKISPSFISSINTGYYFPKANETYPLYQYYKDDKDYDELIDLLLNSDFTLKKISELLGISYSTVKKINAGTLRHGLYPNYPIRPKTRNEQRADRIKQFLLEGYSNKDISKITGASEETVRRIKIGETFYDESLTYPLKPVETISGLTESSAAIDTQSDSK